MSININFQNLPTANTKILEKFNSEQAAKALEAYQPLNNKKRKSEKLKALQILKTNSGSSSLDNIQLNETSLSSALSQAEGATLQAMLNLLSANMIEQNKNMFYRVTEAVGSEQEEQNKKKKEQKQKQEQSNQRREEKKKENKVDNDIELDPQQQIKRLVDSVKEYLLKAQEAIIHAYEDVVDALSLKKLRSMFDENIKSFSQYMTETPMEFIDQNIINPIYEFPQTIKDFIEESLESARGDDRQSFDAEEIRRVLRVYKDNDVYDDKLKNSITSLQRHQNVSKAAIKNKIGNLESKNQAKMPLLKQG